MSRGREGGRKGAAKRGKNGKEPGRESEEGVYIWWASSTGEARQQQGKHEKDKKEAQDPLPAESASDNHSNTMEDPTAVNI